MPTAQYTLLVDFQNNGTFTGAFDNITTRTYNIECRTGRDFNSYLSGKSQPGQLVAVINNRSGNYSPLNTNSPLAGKVAVGRRVQLRTGSGNILWTGHLAAVKPGPKVEGNNTVVFEAIGPLGFINQKIVQAGLDSNVNTGTEIGYILDQAGWDNVAPAGGRQIGTGISTLKAFWTGTVRALDALQKVEEAEAGQLWEATNGDIAFSNRHFRSQTSRCTTSQAILSDSPTSTFAYTGIDSEDPLRYIYNEVRAMVHPTTIGGIRTTLWTMAEGSHNGLSPIIPASGTLTVWARFPNKNSTAEGVGVEFWYMPTIGTTNVGQAWANSSPTGSGTNMSNKLATAGLDWGNRAELMFTNTATMDAYLTKMEVTGDPVILLDPMEVVVQDTTSQDRYGIRTYPLPSDFYAGRTEAADIAKRFLVQFKDPQPLLTVTIAANRTTSILNQVCNRLIQDRVTLIATGSTSLGINRDFYIESISHRIDGHKVHTTQWQLTPVIALPPATATSSGTVIPTGTSVSNYWVLGSSELDNETTLSG
jgi:hypothetical protein